MRLLQLNDDGDFNLVEHVDRDVPQYAILSHTWGADHEEVSFRDVMKGTGKSKLGYRKLTFCAKQATQDGLRLFWVDTCCIDKSSSAELSEAINSMFQWYLGAARCYVYLSDVSTASLSGTDLPFEKSRWFTRGWTLQELLAPKSVEFFSVEGDLLGDKDSLAQEIAKITRISIEALQGRPLSEFGIDERMGWAQGRQTKRKEDAAYALLGIFDIHMPLIYGEGKAKAFKRLQKEIEESLEEASGARVQGTKTGNQKEKLGEICKWLSAPDPSTNYHKAGKQRQADTGLWFLESEQFARWKMDAASRLWLYGAPGCGKTILSSTIIQSLLQHCCDASGMVTVYFYFDFNDTQKQDPGLMLCSLLCQLSQRSINVPRSLDALFSSYGSGRQPSLDALLAVTQQVIHEFTHVYIVLDALDECTQRSKLLDLLGTIASWQLHSLHLLMTSRKERDIESFPEAYVDEKDTVCLQSEVVDKDIRRYIRQRLSDDKSLAKWNKDAVIREEIETALMRGACGMFRWAACQLDALEKCRNRAMLRKSLETLPPTLDQTYDRILSAIHRDDSPYAIRILQWLTLSAWPLSVEEVAEVVAIDIAHDPTFERDEVLEDPLDVLNICSSLLVVTTHKGVRFRDQARQVVAFAHYSVKEYLLSERIFRGPAARYGMRFAECHQTILEGCLGYLLQNYEVNESLFVHLPKFKLAQYAANFWVHHALAAECKTKAVSKQLLNLLSKENDCYRYWLWIYSPDYPRGTETIHLYQPYMSCHAPLYYTSLCGLAEVSRLLLERNDDVNARGGRYGNALQAAVQGGYEKIVKLLLDAGADVNAQGGHYGNALQAASYGGYEKIVKLLLDAGADVSAEVGGYGSALRAASWTGRTQVVKILLDAGANIKTQNTGYGSPLQVAALQGYQSIMKLLLDAGVDVNTQDGHHGSALQAASAGGHEQIVKLLLDAGADVNAHAGHYDSAFYTVSSTGHERVLENWPGGCDYISEYDEDDDSAFYADFTDGTEPDIMPEPNSDDENDRQDEDCSNALYAASIEGHEKIAVILLNAGADVNAQGGDYGNALQAAVQGGYEKMAKLLLDAGADVNAQGGYHGNALQAAVQGGYEKIVKLLLDVGADVNAQGGHYGNALQAAVQGGYEKMVKLLLDKGANPLHEERLAQIPY